MADRRAKYKQKGDNFGDLESSRMSRLEKQDQRRKEIRNQNFSRLRPLDEITKTHTSEKSETQITRNEKLEKWKKQKELKKRTDKKVVKKPPFKVGIVHHKVYSPPIYNNSQPSCSHWNPHSQTRSKVQTAGTPQKKITRVTEKRLAERAAKAAASVASKKSFAPPNYKFKAPAGLSNIPIFGRVRKGSMDVSTLSWNVTVKKSPVKSSLATTCSSNQRKKSNSLSRISPRKSRRNSFHKQFEKSPVNNKTRRSIRRSEFNSNSSVDSSTPPVFSDDNEVFDSELEDQNSAEEEVVNKSPLKEAFTDLVEPLDTSISPIKSIDQSSSGEKSNKSKTEIQMEQESLYSLNLQVSDLSEQNNFKETELRQDNCKPLEQYSSQDYSLKLQASDLSAQGLNNSKQMVEESEKIIDSSMDKSLNDTVNVAIFSPYVVTRRGKKEARKEQQIRRGFNRSPEEIPTKETVMQNLNVSVEEEKRTSQYFRCLLESETNRLNEQCDSWIDIITRENPPEEAKELIEQAIGQTKLLVSSKFKQFEGLVRQCEDGQQNQLITCKDLQGFWDMMNVTVKNCESRFEKVEKMRANAWKEDVKIIPTRKRLPSKKKSPSKPAAKSNLRAMILAARQKKKEMELQTEEAPNDDQVMEIWKNVVKDSPTKLPSTTSNRRLSIAPQGSAAKERRLSFARAAMIISQKRKTPESAKAKPDDEVESAFYMETTTVQVHLDESISYINSRQTPGKSILKRVKVETDTTLTDSRLLKSTQKVIFNDNVELNEVEVDEETKNKQSLAASLARIDSMNFDDECVPEVNIRAEKKLNFDDMSFSENLLSSNDDVFEPPKNTPDFNIIAPTPNTRKSLNTSAITETSEKTEENVRITRNRAAMLESQSSSAEKTAKSPRFLKKRKLDSDLQNLSLEEKTPKSPRSVRVKSEQSPIDETKRKYTPKSPRLIKKNKMNSDLETDMDEMKSLAKSPRLGNKSKLNSTLNNSIVEEQLESTIDDEDLYRRSLRNRTIIGSLTPKSAKKMNKETPASAKIGNPANSFPVISESSILSSLERENSLRSSKRILRSPILKLSPSKQKSVLTPIQQKAIEDISAHQLEKETKISDLLNESRKTPRKMDKTKELEKKVTPNEKKQSNSPAEQIAKVKNSFSLLYKFIKSPVSASKKNKSVNDSTESMDVDSGNESNGSSKCRKSHKTPKSDKKSNKVESIHKKESLHTSLIQKKSNPESKLLNRSLKISVDEVHNEKENTSPRVFRRASSVRSPKPVETPSKRKSIKRSMSCHVAECQVDYHPSTPQVQRSNSSRLSKIGSNRRSIKPMTSVSP